LPDDNIARRRGQGNRLVAGRRMSRGARRGVVRRLVRRRGQTIEKQAKFAAKTILPAARRRRTHVKNLEQFRHIARHRIGPAARFAINAL